MIFRLGMEQTDKICVGSGIGYVSYDQDRVPVEFIRRGLEKNPQCFQLCSRENAEL